MKVFAYLAMLILKSPVGCTDLAIFASRAIVEFDHQNVRIRGLSLGPQQ